MHGIKGSVARNIDKGAGVVVDEIIEDLAGEHGPHINQFLAAERRKLANAERSVIAFHGRPVRFFPIGHRPIPPLHPKRRLRRARVPGSGHTLAIKR
jgi:hypothetical protein